MQLCHKVMSRSFARSSVKHLPHCDEIHTDDCPRNKQRSPRAQFEYREECSARKVFAARCIRKLGHGLEALVMYQHVLSLSMPGFNTTQPWEAVIAFLAASQPAEEGVFGEAFCHFDLFHSTFRNFTP